MDYGLVHSIIFLSPAQKQNNLHSEKKLLQFCEVTLGVLNRKHVADSLPEEPAH